MESINDTVFVRSLRMNKIADLFLYWYEHNYISEAVDNPNLQAIVHILIYCSSSIISMI